ncbi:papain like protease [Lacibacter cauensis]|uniref:Papain like protease n=1 Tax=Lacibacter cauensis TaxID=510947 RepID=A0A562SIG5_9BACT|nr:C1 family peptidase [Lacibacter cauensis]TWI81079.1 papain like protease [Lacibacter cauensis]
MPIRMTDDPQDQQEQYNNDGGGGGNFPVGPGGGGRGGGGLLNLLPLLLSMFGRGGGGGGKGIILLLVVALGAYFLLGRGGCNVSDLANLATGGFLDPKQFEKAEIYEPLADDDTKNPLPESANLQRFCPTPQNQGSQGSCVAWSSAFAAHTILEAARTGKQPNEVAFSPSFMYNQIGLDGCQGSYIIRAMEFMTKRGDVPFDQFPYNDQDCQTQPNNNLQQTAQQYRMRGFNRLSLGDRNDVVDLQAIKQNLSQGAPVVIGMMVGQSFMQPMMGQDLWVPAPGDRSMMGFGGHAMCVVGYDDKKYSGSFLLMNSWGQEWGVNGFAWVRYGDFQNFVREAYGVNPMHAGNEDVQQFACEVGLVSVQYDGKKTVAGDYIALRNMGGNRFETTTALRPGDKFKMELKNTTECYVYVFGKEVDGTSYTLFPYPRTDDPTKTKYSPFCGITGVRLFPKDKSMTPDSIGNRDVIAVVVSKKELDWYQLNQQISSDPSADFGSRLNRALGSSLIRNVRYSSTGKGTMRFDVNGDANNVVACIVEITK